MKNTPSVILVVDDDRTILTIIEALLKKNGYEVITALSGLMAKQVITENHKKIDAVLLDRMMPDMDGIDVVKWINNNKKISTLQIIMLTILDRPEQVKEGIDEGVFYYLTKPIQEPVLKSVVASAVRESKQHKLLTQELKRHRNGFKLLMDASFKIRTIEEAEDVACFITNAFPEPSKILPGVAALIVNAIEHGNCQIFYDEKSKLISEGTWKEEIEKRLTLEENKNKFVDIVFNKEGEKYTIKITDQGQGFVWKKFIVVDPSRALDNHGRGIARANMIFDSLEYNKQGNQVVAIVDKTGKESFVW
jgi:two-component system cell cycle response regulator